MDSRAEGSPPEATAAGQLDSALSRTPKTPSVHSTARPQPRIVNSRRKKCYAVPYARSTVSSPEFIQPSKMYSTGRQPGTPPFSLRGADLSRQIQISGQPSKADYSKSNNRRDNKPKPYLLEPPSQAERFPNSGCSDFYPWKGNHPEDHVTDAQARNGQYDKLFVGKSNNEQASARSVLAATFKQKQGMPTLSRLFLNIFDERQKCSRLSASCTFKPPPRVTLPDQRRETWLRDLANPSAPLRRLSRTIPHGLKGPSLLEQCASKSIPVPRAVWFIRCVGANELRGLKRKGVGSFAVGGESKWIREWTVQVIQFTEKAINMCGEGSPEPWYDKLIYIFRLVAHLYAEWLLDRIAFLEWCLSFLGLCSLDHLPLAYTLAIMFGEEILNVRKLANRFTEIMFARAELMTTHDSYLPLIRRMSLMFAYAHIHHRRSLTTSRNAKLGSISSFLTDSRDNRVNLCRKNVLNRGRAIESSCAASLAPSNSDFRHMVDFLDEVNSPSVSAESFQQLVRKSNPYNVIHCICEWTVTSRRAGSHRVYLSVSFLNRLHGSSVDVQKHVMAFMDSFDSRTRGQRTYLYLLVSELVRAKIFSVGAYMKWLIARGSLAGISSLDDDCPTHVRLLAEIPMHSASPQLRNLRRILLAGCGFQCDQEEKLIVDSREYLVSRGIFNDHGSGTGELDGNAIKTLRALSRTVKSEIGIWIGDTVRDIVSRGQRGQNWQDTSNGDPLKSLKAPQMLLIREVLEIFGDLVVLADIVKAMLMSQHCDILKMAAETIAVHSDAFAALDLMSQFSLLIVERYKQLKESERLDKGFVVPLAEFSPLIGIGDSMAAECFTQATTFDRHEPKPRTPISVSESMDDLFDDMVDNHEEIDHLWNNGETVDRPTMSRLFETTVSKMESLLEDGASQAHITSSSRGLIKLREFDSSFFDGLLAGWLTRMRYSRNGLSFFRSLSMLIANSCAQLNTMVNIALDANPPNVEEHPPYTDQYRFVARCLELLLYDDPTRTELSAQEFYTLRTKRLMFVHMSPQPCLRLYRRAIELCSLSQSHEAEASLRTILGSASSLDLLRRISSRDKNMLKDEVTDPILRNGRGRDIKWLQLFMDHILDDHDPNDDTELDLHIQVARLLNLADDFSFEFCKLKLQTIFYANSERIQQESVGVLCSTAHSIARSFITGIASAYDDRRRICSDLLLVLSSECANQIRTDVEELYLDQSLFMRRRPLLDQLGLPSSNDREAGESLARALLSVIDATASSIPNTGLFFMPPQLVDRLSKLLQSMTAIDCDSTNIDPMVPDLEWHNSEASAELRSWLLLFMKVVTIHRSSFFLSKSSPHELVRMIYGLSCLLQHEFLLHDEATAELIHDTTSSYSEGLSEEARAQLRRCVRGKHAPSAMSYFVGLWDNAECLQANQRGKVVDFPIKAWERLAEPTPVIGENDTSLSLGLFKTRRT